MEEPCALIAHARFCEGCEIQSPEREKGFHLLDRHQRDSRDPARSEAKESSGARPQESVRPERKSMGKLKVA